MAATEKPENPFEEADKLAAIDKRVDQEKQKLAQYEKQQGQLEQVRELEVERLQELKNKLRIAADKKNTIHDEQDRKLKIYQEKFRHLLMEHESSTSDSRIKAEGKKKAKVSEQSSLEHEYREDLRSLLVKQKEQSLKHMELLSTLRMEQEKRLTEIREEFMQKTEYLRTTYEEKMRELRQLEENTRHESRNRVELEKNKRIQITLHSQDKKFHDVKNYFNDITHASLDLIKSLKGEVAETSKKEKEKEQAKNDVLSVHRQLEGPLKQLEVELEDLKAKQELHAQDKQNLARALKHSKQFESEVEKLNWDVELKRQRIQQIREENLKLKKHMQTTSQAIQQSQGFKRSMLKEKMRLKLKRIEEVEIVLGEVLTRAKVDQNQILGDERIKTLEQVAKDRDVEISRLEQLLQERKENYYSAIHFYETAMKNHQIPIGELGFLPNAI